MERFFAYTTVISIGISSLLILVAILFIVPSGESTAAETSGNGNIQQADYGGEILTARALLAAPLVYFAFLFFVFVKFRKNNRLYVNLAALSFWSAAVFFFFVLSKGPFVEVFSGYSGILLLVIGAAFICPQIYYFTRVLNQFKK
jgi:hypothetical protein